MLEAGTEADGRAEATAGAILGSLDGGGPEEGRGGSGLPKAGGGTGDGTGL